MLDQAPRPRRVDASGSSRLGGTLLAPLFAVLLTVLSSLAGPSALVRAQAGDVLSPGITLTADPLLDGNVRRGQWAAVRVHLENDGPAVDGELRISGMDQGAATYGVVVQLATGARQDHVIHGKAGFFGSRFTIDLVHDGGVVATTTVMGTAVDPETLGVYVIAERPERLVADLRASVAARVGGAAKVVAITPEALPERAEAWAAVDRLVWQDVPASRLTAGQHEALRTWVALGGELVILGGSAGTGAIDGFPEDLLPYQPDGIVDASVSDLADLLGPLPAEATSLPALGGMLTRGVALGLSGGRVIAARAAHGQGSVALIGIDPATRWLAGSPAVVALWARAMSVDAPPIDPRDGQDDSMLVDALNYLPSVGVPRMDHLFLLFLGYVILLGPVNYLVLRRLDRREWAWITMPALVVVFTVAAFVLGVVLRGTDVVINELGIVQGAAGTDRGMADVYVGIFSPARGAFDVRLPGGAFVSAPSTDEGSGNALPLDVVMGDPAHVRGFQVGHGALRAFRAEAVVDTPRMEADLRLVGDHVVGTLRNASDGPLDDVALAYGGGLQVLADMAPGETRQIDVTPSDRAVSARTLVQRLFGGTDADGTRATPVSAARIAIVRSLAGGREWDTDDVPDPLAAYGPVILAWRSGGVLDIDVGAAADRAGDTLYLLPVRVVASGPVSFSGGTVQQSVLGVDAVDSFVEGDTLFVARGSMTVAYRPAGLEGTFKPTDLRLRLGPRRQAPADAAEDLAPLPADRQPDQDDPVGTGQPGAAVRGMPGVQLFDRVAARWVELEPLTASTSYRISDPGRYVDASGTFLVRYVSRAVGDGASFAMGVRLAGALP